MEWSEELIQEALDTYAPEYFKRGEVLTRDDAIEILDNLKNFGEILIEFYQKSKEKAS